MNQKKTRSQANGQGIRRQQVFFGAVVVSCLLGFWIAYELGQIRAGHNGFEAQREYEELEDNFDDLQSENTELRRQIAVLETSRKIDQEAYAQVEAQLTGLQQEILAQEEDLEFYRGIVADQQTGLRVQDLELLSGTEPDLFNLRLVLAQSMRATKRIEGSVEFEFEGELNGEPETLALKDFWVGEPQSRLEFSFRYFQNLEAALELPEGFKPETVTVKLKGKDTKAIERKYAWVVRSN